MATKRRKSVNRSVGNLRKKLSVSPEDVDNADFHLQRLGECFIDDTATAFIALARYIEQARRRKDRRK